MIGATRRALPEPTSTRLFNADGRWYTVLRFAGGNGPNFAETLAIETKNSGKRLLTIGEADAITMDRKLAPFLRKSSTQMTWPICTTGR